MFRGYIPNEVVREAYMDIQNTDLLIYDVSSEHMVSYMLTTCNFSCKPPWSSTSDPLFLEKL